jgi:hypothetical protein
MVFDVYAVLIEIINGAAIAYKLLCLPLFKIRSPQHIQTPK